MRREEVRTDVSAGLGWPDPVHTAATVFTPASGLFSTVLVYSPGGTYRRSCVDLQVPGYAGYSLAEHLTGAGLCVVAVDTLGTGDGDQPDDGDRIGLDQAARALSETTRAVVDRLSGGDRDLTTVGVGHSLGGAVTVRASVRHASFDAVGLVGYSPTWSSLPSVADRPAAGDPAAVRRWTRAALTTSDPALWAGSYVRFPRLPDDPFSYRPDVPAVVRAAAAAHGTVVPRGLAVDYGISEPAMADAAAVTAPMLLAFGSHDVSDPATERRLYPLSPAVAEHLTPDAGHDQNTAQTRALLWDRMAQWSQSVPPRRGSTS